MVRIVEVLSELAITVLSKYLRLTLGLQATFQPYAAAVHQQKAIKND